MYTYERGLSAPIYQVRWCVLLCCIQFFAAFSFYFRYALRAAQTNPVASRFLAVDLITVCYVSHVITLYLELHRSTSFVTGNVRSNITIVPASYSIRYTPVQVHLHDDRLCSLRDPIPLIRCSIITWLLQCV